MGTNQLRSCSQLACGALLAIVTHAQATTQQNRLWHPPSSMHDSPATQQPQMMRDVKNRRLTQPAFVAAVTTMLIHVSRSCGLKPVNATMILQSTCFAQRPNMFDVSGTLFNTNFLSLIAGWTERVGVSTRRTLPQP